MSNKIECPGCESYTSSVARAVSDGDPCPYCGLSADAIRTVLEARERHGETKLVEQITEALKRAEKAEHEAKALRAALRAVRTALTSVDLEAKEDTTDER